MRFLLAALTVLLLAACDQAPITWNQPTELAAPAPGMRLSVNADGTTRFVDDSIQGATVPEFPNLCRRSVEFARGRVHLYAAWWSVRPDSSGLLSYAASMDSGRTWTRAAPVDTADISSRGCERPPPSVTAVGDDMYVAYSMEASEGTGVFFAHTMTGMLHSPVAVIYGDRLVSTAIAAEGDRVAVAYEAPNGTRPQIDIGLSSTMGHIFEVHTMASRDVDVATAPSIAIAGRTIAVAWKARRFGTNRSSSIVRVGRFE